MNEQNAKLSVIAYYLSKFDMEAVKKLGYSNRNEAMRNISLIIGSGNNYLKLRRDEFDVLTGSHRRGYANRKPIPSVLDIHNQLKDITFDDFTNIVAQFLQSEQLEPPESSLTDSFVIDLELSDNEIEAIINSRDSTSTIVVRQTEQKIRVYNPAIIKNLKKLYNYRCQICGVSTQEYGAHIAEGHHILSFSESRNNNPDNIMILCPNHHRLIHCAKPTYDKERKQFVFFNGLNLPIIINLHL